MLVKTSANLSIFTLLLLLLLGCGGSESGDVEQIVDNEKPKISCSADIAISIAANESNSVVTYDFPLVSDNVGATTNQTAGLSSGMAYPVGTTTNTFQATDAAGNSSICSFSVTITRNAPLSSEPFFVANNPAPAGKKWSKAENLSDEFDGASLDEVKWKNTDPTNWIGRSPGIFKMNTVSQSDGNLRLTCYLLDNPEEVNGNTFTHAGSNITSNASAQVGQYFECRMKANKTFMSSTFWLINKRNEKTGCDKRTTELDIQECVGQITATAAWAQNTDQRMGSNTHSRNTSCAETPTGSVGNEEALADKVYKDYHVYGAWWKSLSEIEFYLDGIKVATVVPKAEFNLKMYLRMVVETYDWNPVPNGGGMSGNEDERTTYYDWVRTWELK